MVQRGQGSTHKPLFSIVVAVYNDWTMLNGCLQSLEEQTNAPSFEVIIVDDGSTEPSPQFVRSSMYSYPLAIIRQPHKGIPGARNRGVQDSKGSVLVFVDADCRLQTNCLAALSSTIANSPQHNSFQLRLVGHCSNLVGRAEELRLVTFQNHMLQKDGRIRYLNTAGFAIRRAKLDIETGVFNPVALRGEDTLLLADLMLRGELPLFVSDAVVEHVIQLTLLGWIRKDVRSVYLEKRAYDIIASKGVRIRITYRERARLLLSSWKTAGQRPIGRSAWFALVFRQALRRLISVGFECL
jgi:glycosyltransferase involved in cell wall biosynthesis